MVSQVLNTNPKSSPGGKKNTAPQFQSFFFIHRYHRAIQYPASEEYHRVFIHPYMHITHPIPPIPNLNSRKNHILTHRTKDPVQHLLLPPGFNNGFPQPLQRFINLLLRVQTKRSTNIRRLIPIRQKHISRKRKYSFIERCRSDRGFRVAGTPIVVGDDTPSVRSWRKVEFEPIINQSCNAIKKCEKMIFLRTRKITQLLVEPTQHIQLNVSPSQPGTRPSSAYKIPKLARCAREAHRTPTTRVTCAQWLAWETRLADSTSQSTKKDRWVRRNMKLETEKEVTSVSNMRQKQG